MHNMSQKISFRKYEQFLQRIVKKIRSWFSEVFKCQMDIKMIQTLLQNYSFF